MTEREEIDQILKNTLNPDSPINEAVKIQDVLKPLGYKVEGFVNNGCLFELKLRFTNPQIGS